MKLEHVHDATSLRFGNLFPSDFRLANALEEIVVERRQTKERDGGS